MSLYAECLGLSLDWDSTEDIVYGCVDHVSKVKEAEVQRLEAKIDAGRVELRAQWERMQGENLAAKDLIAEKDAEIERLQKRVLELIDLTIAERKLITKLADALETTKESGTSHDDWKALVEKLAFAALPPELL